MTRTTDLPIEKAFIERWSPRAMTGESIPKEALLTMFEAARWAPSAYNFQPWRFVYVTRDSAQWDAALATLVEFNRSWAKQASALVLVAAKTTELMPGATEESANGYHAFDTGAAWAGMAMQAHMMGWATHGMAGFDRAAASSTFGLPEGYAPLAMVAVGKVGDKASLPEMLQQREAPSPRKALSEIAFEGTFKQPA